MLVLSDIHANLPALEAVLADAPDETILCCGDITGYYPWPNEVVRVLEARDVTAVRGNHDSAILLDEAPEFGGVLRQALGWQRARITPDTRAFIEGLPTRVETRVDGYRVVMVHGSPTRPLDEYVHPEDVDARFLERQGVNADILLMGHTHVPFAKRVEGTLVANPGSVGQPRDGNPHASYAVLSGGGITHRRVPYPVEEVVAAWRRRVSLLPWVSGCAAASEYINGACAYARDAQLHAQEGAEMGAARHHHRLRTGLHAGQRLPRYSQPPPALTVLKPAAAEGAMLTLVGLGLRDGDISRNGMAALESADVAYAEFYTNSIRYDLGALESATGTAITVLERDAVEDEDRVVAGAETRHVVFLVSGDPLTATTHQDILFRARERGIDARVVHAPSILTAVAETGLSLYKFGRTTTLPEPYEGRIPGSPFDVIAANREQGLHTLLLLDIGMTVAEALAVAGDRLPAELLGVTRLGTDDAQVRYGHKKDLTGMTAVPAAVIVPGELSDNERERVERFHA